MRFNNTLDRSLPEIKEAPSFKEEKLPKQNRYFQEGFLAKGRTSFMNSYKNQKTQIFHVEDVFSNRRKLAPLPISVRKSWFMESVYKKAGRLNESIKILHQNRIRIMNRRATSHKIRLKNTNSCY